VYRAIFIQSYPVEDRGMSHRRFAQGVSIAMALALSLLSAGCIPFAFVYPEVTYIPSPMVKNDDSVYVFRVDRKLKSERGGFWIAGWIARHSPEEKLSLLSRSTSGNWEAQKNITLEGGYSVPLYSTFEFHQTVLRLYRPGYETVEIRGLPWKQDIQWIRADDRTAREEALDKIWSCPKNRPWPNEVDWNQENMPNQEQLYRYVNIKVDTPEPLLFLASEYERIANVLQHCKGVSEEDRKHRTRLVNKAHYLRSLATVNAAASQSSP
jgi:hypothetical protein